MLELDVYYSNPWYQYRISTYGYHISTSQYIDIKHPDHHVKTAVAYQTELGILCPQYKQKARLNFYNNLPDSSRLRGMTTCLLLARWLFGTNWRFRWQSDSKSCAQAQWEYANNSLWFLGVDVLPFNRTIHFRAFSVLVKAILVFNNATIQGCRFMVLYIKLLLHVSWEFFLNSRIALAHLWIHHSAYSETCCTYGHSCWYLITQAIKFLTSHRFFRWDTWKRLV